MNHLTSYEIDVNSFLSTAVSLYSTALPSFSSMHWIDVWFTTPSFSHLQGHISTPDVHASCPHWTKTGLRLRLSSSYIATTVMYTLQPQNYLGANANESANFFSKMTQKRRGGGSRCSLKGRHALQRLHRPLPRFFMRHHSLLLVALPE